MDYENIKTWLDTLIDHLHQEQALEQFNNQIYLTSPDTDIYFRQGIDLVADIMGLELRERDISDMKIKPNYVYSFTYRDTKFLQLGEKRLETGTGGEA